MITLQMATLIQSILTSVGIIVGGVWVYFHYFRGRTYSPRLEAHINGRVIPKPDAVYLILTARLSNLGLSKVEIQQRGSGIRVLSYSTNLPVDVPAFCGVEAAHLGTFSVFEDHAWIESKETIDDEIMVFIRQSDLVALRVELRVVTAQVSWRDVRIIEVPVSARSRKNSTNGTSEAENG